jgi:hypothetical protein
MENLGSLFVQASRSKFRFNTAAGVITVEDLWDLPLTDSRKANLDDIAKSLNKQLKETSEEQSFVVTKTGAAATRANEVKAKFDLVLFVIKTKMEERDAALLRAEKEANKQKIMALIERKKDEALAGKSAEELMALLNTM